MREIARVLKPGGRAVIGVPNKYEWFGKSLALDLFAVLHIKEDGHEHSYGWGELTRELESCGLQVISKNGPYFMPWFIRAADWFLHQRAPSLTVLLVPFIVVCDWLSTIPFFQRHGSLLAAVVQKPLRS
jgi:SAM-dependent methyltransferase